MTRLKICGLQLALLISLFKSLCSLFYLYISVIITYSVTDTRLRFERVVCLLYLEAPGEDIS